MVLGRGKGEKLLSAPLAELSAIIASNHFAKITLFPSGSGPRILEYNRRSCANGAVSGLSPSGYNQLC